MVNRPEHVFMSTVRLHFVLLATGTFFLYFPLNDIIEFCNGNKCCCLSILLPLLFLYTVYIHIYINLKAYIDINNIFHSRISSPSDVHKHGLMCTILTGVCHHKAGN